MNEKLNMMETGKISTVLLKMGIPTMIGMLVSALYSIVDAYFAGWLGTSQQGAIAIVFPIVQIMIGLGMTFGTGGASYIARLLGKKEYTKANKVASTSLFSSIFVGIVLIVISLIFLKSLLCGLGATQTILLYAISYAVIYIAGSIFNIFNVTMNNIVAAEGRTKLTMISMMVGGGLNMILDPIFMFTFSMGVQGAAVATVLAQAITSGIYVWFILSKKGSLRIHLHDYRFQRAMFGEILKVGIPVFLYQLFSSISMGMTSIAASAYGDSAVAAFGDTIRFMTLGTYVIFGFLKGFQPVVGYNYGAGNYERVKKLIDTTLIWATTYCVLIAVVLMIFSKSLISIFTSQDMELIVIGEQALRANGYIFALFGVEQVIMALFLALGKGMQGGLLSLGRQGIFFIPAVMILPHFFGLQGLIWVQPIADALTILLSIVFFLPFMSKMNGRKICFAKE